MHVIDPVAGNIAIVLLIIFAATMVLNLAFFLIDLSVVLPRRVEDFLEALLVPSIIVLVLTLFGGVGCSIAADANIQDQLQAQAQSRYGIQISDSQMNDLWHVKERDTRTGKLDGRTVKLMGSTITNDGKVITLVESGDTYLLERANLTELPTAR